MKKAYDLGVRNTEMESLLFGAFCNSVGVRAAVICAVVNDIMEKSQIEYSPK